MFGGFQSSNQDNIVNNNISSSVSNSTGISSTLVVDQAASVSAYNSAQGDTLRLHGCHWVQDIDVTQNVSQDITSISKSDTSYDNNLSTDITNDLQNDLTQETPGFAGGFFSAQVNNQLNKVSNDVRNNIRNSVSIDRQNFISSLAKTDGQNTLDYKTVDCTDSDISQSVHLDQDLTQNALVKANDKITMKNIIVNTLHNTLKNTASQGPSLLGAIAFIVFCITGVIGKESDSNGVKIFSVWFGSYIFSAIIMGIIMYINESLPIAGPVIEYTTSWFPGSKYCEDEDFEDRGVDPDKCAKNETDRMNWKFTWKDDSIRKHMDIEDIFSHSPGGKLSDTFTQNNEGSPCPNGSDGDNCRSASEDIVAEKMLRSSIECSNIYDKDTNTFSVSLDDNDFHYHHDFYAHIGDDNKWTEDENIKVNHVTIRHDEKKSHPDESVYILQPGTGYLTGGPYITRCRNKDGTKCCKPGKTCEDGDDSNLQVNLSSGNSCATDPDFLAAGVTREEGSAENYGLDCYQSMGEVGASAQPLSGSLKFNQENNPISCSTETTWSEITKFVGYCADTPSSPCMSADKCSVNYITYLNKQDVANDKNQDKNTNSEIDLADISNFCTPAPSSPPDSTTHGCVYEVNGVDKIVINNSDTSGVKEKHQFHSDNIYTIESNPSDPQYRKPVYHENEFEVQWSNLISSPPEVAIPAESGKWATSALIKTTNNLFRTDSWSHDPFTGGAASPESICRGDPNPGTISGKRRWEGMENICESKFKLNPILSKKWDDQEKEKKFNTSSGGNIQLGCELTEATQTIDRQCYCTSGVNLTKSFNSTGWWVGLFAIPLLISFICLIGAICYFEQDSDKPTSSETTTTSSEGGDENPMSKDGPSP